MEELLLPHATGVSVREGHPSRGSPGARAGALRRALGADIESLAGGGRIDGDPSGLRQRFSRRIVRLGEPPTFPLDEARQTNAGDTQNTRAIDSIGGPIQP